MCQMGVNFDFNIMEEKPKEEKTNYFDFTEVLGYFFRKKDPTRPKNFSIRAMHTINKISMFIFLCAVIFIIVRAILRS